MNKRELTACVARKTGLTNTVLAKAVDAVFQSIKESLENSESTTIVGFGSFSIIDRAERMGINPSTKQPITIPARKAVKFSASKAITIK
ncbi:MAG: HU family DNA-binding protein [Tannerellaceae bacterium]